MNIRCPAKILLSLFLMLLVSGQGQSARAVEPKIDRNARCPVCGMFVAKYPQWVTQLSLSDGGVESFDGVKDMMAYILSPRSYGAAAGVTVGEISVKDYYSQKWIDGRKASYVIGSDVYGPMGHELIPFADRSHAESFRQDHKGRQILDFAEITPQLVESLRHGHKMMGHGKKQ